MTTIRGNVSGVRRRLLPTSSATNVIVRASMAVHDRYGRVEDGRGSLGATWPSPRFPSPLIKPDVPISGIRLSDWLHRKAHGDKLTARGFGTVSNSPSPLDTAISGGACH